MSYFYVLDYDKKFQLVQVKLQAQTKCQIPCCACRDGPEDGSHIFFRVDSAGGRASQIVSDLIIELHLQLFMIGSSERLQAKSYNRREGKHKADVIAYLGEASFVLRSSMTCHWLFFKSCFESFIGSVCSQCLAFQGQQVKDPSQGQEPAVVLHTCTAFKWSCIIEQPIRRLP